MIFLWYFLLNLEMNILNRFDKSMYIFNVILIFPWFQTRSKELYMRMFPGVKALFI